MNELTDFKFWENYWANAQIAKTESVFFSELVRDFPDNVESIEIGGFPGKLAVYFNKEKKCKVTILDFFISETIVEKVEDINNLERGEIKTIKTDFFTYNSEKKYDIVSSFGFIEHFENTKEVIQRHVDLLKIDGYLLITLPNFRGLNGWVQKKYDKRNYDIHNINSMDLNLLKDICRSLNLKSYQVGFFGRPTVWIEPDAKTSNLTKLFLKFLSKLLRFFPFIKNQFFSPFIYLKAIK